MKGLKFEWLVRICVTNTPTGVPQVGASPTHKWRYRSAQYVPMSVAPFHWTLVVNSGKESLDQILIFQINCHSMPKLIIGGTTYELVDELITIGRGPDNNIVINNPSVSARHAQLQLASHSYRLKDLSSTNGTRVNGKPVTETLLSFDDRIRFGAAEATYEGDKSGSRPLPDLEEIKANPAELSAVPPDFTNVSPFPRQERKSDPVRNGIFVGLAIVLLIFLGSMIAVLMMRAPGL